MTSGPAADAKIYHALLYLYPPGFRREFAPEMLRDFREARREWWLAERWRGLTAFWACIAADLARTLVVQWLRTSLPLVILGAPLPAVAAVAVIARVRPKGPFAGVPPRDHELTALLLMIAVVLLVVATTIIATLCFTRPLLYRRRV